MRHLPLLLACGLIAMAPVPLAARGLAADDYYRLDALQDLTLSADGAWIAYVAGRADQDSDGNRNTLWLGSWDGRQHQRVPVTDGAAHSPRFSPDGRFLAVIGKAAGATRPQLLLVDRANDAVRALTDVTGDIGEYAWSPDGSRIAFVMESLPEPPPPDGAPPRPLVIDALYFKEDPHGYIQQGQRQHLYVVAVASGRLLAVGAEAQFNDDHPAWSPDGTRLAFVRTRERAADPDGMSDLDVIEALGSAPPQRLARIFSPNLQHLAWSPDGRLVAFQQGREPRYNNYMQDRLAVVPAAGGAVRPLSDALDRATLGYAFAADGAILALVADDASQYPVRIDTLTGRVQRLYTAAAAVTGIATAGGHVAVLVTDDRTPDEAYALEDGRIRALTAHNAAVLADITLGEVSELKFHSRDGTEVHGLWVKPPAYVAGRRYPTLLWLHGGANLQDTHGLTIDEYQFKRQLLAARGYVVLGINYRGSTGRGEAFSRAIAGDWGHREVEDVLAGVEALVAQGIADPQRLGIGGWSYGGLLTDYTIASDGRFGAAVSGAGAGNQLGMYGSDQYILANNAELGPPWRFPATWLRVSYPFFHADRIHTPTLFLGGDRDFNVPVAGSEQMYQALRTLGVPTQLVVYPGETHDIERPSFLVDRMLRIADWFDRYLRRPP